MNKKRVIPLKAAALFMTLALLCVCLPPFTGADTSITSFGSSGLYFWKWQRVTTNDTFFSSGLVSLGSEPNHGVLYRLLITGNNPSTGKNFYLGNYNAKNGSLYSAGRTKDAGWIDRTGDVFISGSHNDTPIVRFDSGTLYGSSQTFNVRLLYPKTQIQYDKNGKITGADKAAFKGLSNGTSCYWHCDDGLGEPFGITLSFEGGVLWNNPANFGGYTGVCHITETDSDKYHWYAGDNYFAETKDSYGKTCDSGYPAELFNLWIGKFCQINGLASGSYEVTPGNVLCAEDDVTVIGRDAVLTVRPGATLTVKGRLYVFGHLTNYGTIIVEDGGQLIIGEPADISDNRGTVSCRNKDNLGAASIAVSGKGLVYVSVGSDLNLFQTAHLAVDGQFVTAGRVYANKADITFTPNSVMRVKNAVTYERIWDNFNMIECQASFDGDIRYE